MHSIHKEKGGKEVSWSCKLLFYNVKRPRIRRNILLKKKKRSNLYADQINLKVSSGRTDL